MSTNLFRPDEEANLRAEALDTIAAVLPMNRRDRLAEILTDQDVETLRHLVNEGHCNVNFGSIVLGDYRACQTLVPHFTVAIASRLRL